MSLEAWPEELHPYIRAGGDLCPDRRKFVTASEVGALCGVSRWTSPYQVWQRKVGMRPEATTSRAMLRGTILEPLVGWSYHEETGVGLRPAEKFEVHPEFDRLGASVDFFADDGRVVEAKTANPMAFKYWDGQPPMTYLLQMQAQLACTGREEGVIAVLVGDDLHYWNVEKHEGAQGRILREAAALWERIDEDRPPEPQPEKDQAEILRRAALLSRTEEMWVCPTCGSQDAECEVCSAVNRMLERYADVSEAVRDGRKELRDIKARILDVAGEKGGVRTAGHAVRIRQTQPYEVKAHTRAAGVRLYTMKAGAD